MITKPTINREIRIFPTVEETAEVFACMYSNEQAEFLKIVARTFKSWGEHEKNIQCLGISKDIGTDPVVRDWLETLLWP
jgi:hypothetical protein